MHSQKPILLIAVVVVLAALSAGCRRGADEQDQLASARAYLDKQDYKSGIILIKSALQKNPNNGEARLLLGQSLLEAGQAAAAAVELRKAIDLQAPESKAEPLLAKALLAQGESRQVIEQFGAVAIGDPAVAADLLTTVAAAHAQQGEREQALKDVLAALQKSPRHTPAILLHARLLAADGDASGAAALADKAVAQDPKNVNALLFKGELQRRQQHDRIGALATFRSAVAANPRTVAGHAAIISMLLEQGDVVAAKAQLKQLEGAQPGHPETRLLQAQFAYMDKDFAKTHDLTEQLLKSLPNDIRVLGLAGAAELRLNSLTLAESHLGRVVKAAPQAPVPRQMLARIYLRTGQPAKALEILQPMLGSAAPDSQSLTLAGEAHLQSGDLASSEAVFARAAKIDPQSTTARTALALNKVARGNADAGFAELEAVAATEKGMQANLSLVTARLRRNDLDGAMKAIDAWIQRQPDKPLAHVLRGRIQLQRKDTAAATASFEKALSIDPQYYPASAGLAALDIGAGKPDSARKRFEDLLRADPKNYRALLGLAELKARTGGSQDEVARALADAAKASPAELAPRVMLVNYLLGQRDAKAALAAARDASASLPNSVEVMDLLGTAQLAAGEAQQAVTTFKKLAELRPDRTEPELRLADAYAAANEPDAARRSLERALKLKPGLVPAERALAQLALRQKQPDRALAIARDMQKAQPKQPAGYLVESEVELARGHADTAIVALRKALQLGDGSETAIKLHQALAGSGHKSDADRFASTWTRDHPRDVAFRYYLGDAALARSDWPAAESHYRSVLDLQPDHALALNNIAWLLARQGKPGAVAAAERANQLQPNQPALMDTLAYALASDHQAPRALELQRKAVARAPDSPGLRLTLARIYVQTGQRAEARTELEALARLGDKFSGQVEVAQLLKSL